MKTRTGFVSNSSTSSFVLLVRKDIHDQVMAELSDFHKHCIKAVSGATKCLGQDVVEIGDLVSHDGEGQISYAFEYEESPFEGEVPEGKYGKISPHEAVDDYKAKAIELGGEDAVFHTSMDG